MACRKVTESNTESDKRPKVNLSHQSGCLDCVVFTVAVRVKFDRSDRGTVMQCLSCRQVILKESQKRDRGGAVRQIGE